MQLPVDVYQCEGCGSAFCVEKDQDVKITPCCESELFEYSHTGNVINEELNNKNLNLSDFEISILVDALRSQNRLGHLPEEFQYNQGVLLMKLIRLKS